MKKALKIMGIIAGSISLLAISLFTSVDRTPMEEMSYYKEMTNQLDNFSFDTIGQEGEYLKAGWSKKSITPSYFPDLAGYGLRNKARCIHDSVFVRAIAFSNGRKKAVILTLDLLIFPPIIEGRLLALADSLGYAPESFYLSATHSHSAPGGWAKGVAGRFLAGKFDQGYIELVLRACLAAIHEAGTTMEIATLSVGKAEAPNFVLNRLYQPDSEIDPWIRLLAIRKESGKTALFTTYSAHANCHKINYPCISADYPGRLVQQLESLAEIDFAVYAAGMVGSHTPKGIQIQDRPLENEAYINAYGDSLVKIIIPVLSSLKPLKGTRITSSKLSLPLRTPHLKISKNIRFRPWVFNTILGGYSPNLKLLQINELVLFGMPCDFSGEIMKDFEPLCQEKKIDLYITSFNGGYIGYVNVDKYYDIDRAETRDMNWFGPYNQAYFTEITLRLLKKI